MIKFIVRATLAVLCFSILSNALHQVSVREVQSSLSPEQLRGAVDHSFDIAPDYTLVEVATGSSRQRREAGEHIVLHLQLFNKSMKVDLHRSQIASKSYVVQELGVDGELHDVPHHETDCYFSGYIEGEPDSHVTISLCEDDKMDGMVVSGPHIIVLKPVKDSSYHLAYDATEVIVNNRTVDSTEGGKKAVPYMVRKIEEETRKRRQSGNTKETLEMMVYVDKSAVDFHGSSRVESYVMNMLNIFASLYSDASLGGPPIHVSLVRMIRETSSTSPISTSRTVNTLLNSFCSYQSSSSFPPSDSDAKHHDFAVLLTKCAHVIQFCVC